MFYTDSICGANLKKGYGAIPESLNSWGFLVPPSHIYLIINDAAHTIALYSTVKCNGVPIYNLSLGICENGYPLAHIPTNK